MDLPELPTRPLEVTTLELSYLVHAVWEPAKNGDEIARALLQKIRALAADFGVVVKVNESTK